MNWTRITDPDTVATLLPPWLGRRMVGLHGRFGLLLTTGDVLRLTSITAAHLSTDGTVLLDVLLDSAGVPDGVDQAWQSKHYLGMPVPGAVLATVNLAQVVTAVEFVVAELAVNPDDAVIPMNDTISDDQPPPQVKAVATAA